VFTTVFQPDTPAAAALAAIEAKLTEGHADFLAGQYQPAIDAYHQAASLIYGQLHPQAIGGTGTISISPVLFSPMLSLGLEWMNVLAPTVPVAGHPAAHPGRRRAGRCGTRRRGGRRRGGRRRLDWQGPAASRADGRPYLRCPAGRHGQHHDVGGR
jgi:hypothetical protein